ncbi:MAG: hypothetical protein ACRD5H_17090, partial [Nitrososphaerales archaeon]
DHLLIEEPMSSTELESVAKDVAEDMKITEVRELEEITQFAKDYIARDPRVKVETGGWFYHRGK